MTPTDAMYMYICEGGEKKYIQCMRGADSSGERGRSDIPYSSMTEVLSIGQGVGLWGDILITNKDGSKLELRSIDKFKDTEKYIREQIETAKQTKGGVEQVYAPQTTNKPRGFD